MNRSEIRDPDFRLADRALRRAAKRARALAESTGTPFYIYKNDRIINAAKPRRKKPARRPRR